MSLAGIVTSPVLYRRASVRWPSCEGLPSAGLLTKGFRLSTGLPTKGFRLSTGLPTKGFRPLAFLQRASDCRLRAFLRRASDCPLAFLRRASDCHLQAFLRRASVRRPSYEGLPIVDSHLPPHGKGCSTSPAPFSPPKR